MEYYCNSFQIRALICFVLSPHLPFCSTIAVRLMFFKCYVRSHPSFTQHSAVVLHSPWKTKTSILIIVWKILHIWPHYFSDFIFFNFQPSPTPIRLYWPPFQSSNMPNRWGPRGFCTCFGSLFPKYSLLSTHMAKLSPTTDPVCAWTALLQGCLLWPIYLKL